MTHTTATAKKTRAILYDSDSQHGPGEPPVVHIAFLVVHRELVAISSGPQGIGSYF